ncbi:MAG: hypothetical protein ACRC0X_09670, partial [Brevinema sp.]
DDKCESTMFIKIFSLPLTMYIFAGGFILNFLIVFFRGFPFFNIIWVACVGGFVFCGIWAGIIKILLLLLEERELSSYFDIDSDKYYEVEDSDDLTMDELYSTIDDDPIVPAEDISPSSTVENGLDTYDYLDDELSHTFDHNVSLDSTGDFHLTVNGKTLTASPEDGAKAIKKVLYDDRE